MRRALALCAFCLLLALGCRPPLPRPPADLLPTPKPTPAIMADAFLYGWAFIDLDGNGQWDPSDPPLKGALFTVTEANGRQNGGLTSESGIAMAWYPGGAGFKWPLTMRMQPPKNSAYQPVGPQEQVYEKYPGARVVFLFVLPSPPAP